MGRCGRHGLAFELLDDEPRLRGPSAGRGGRFGPSDGRGGAGFFLGTGSFCTGVEAGDGEGRAGLREG